MNSKLSRRILARTIAQKLVSEPTRHKHWLKMLAAYMVHHKMTDDTDLLVKDIVREVFAQSGQLLVSATTARPLTDSLRKDLTETLRDATGAKHVVLEEHVDPTIVGGFVARTPDAELDASVRTTLQQLAAIK
jgi:F-type H+-transporting ATPase subunit delta